MNQIGDLLLLRARAAAELRMADRMLRACYDAGEGTQAERAVIGQTLKIEDAHKPAVAEPAAVPSAHIFPPTATPETVVAALPPVVPVQPPSEQRGTPLGSASTCPMPKPVRGQKRWSPERDAVVLRDWPDGRDVYEILAELRPLPGLAFPDNDRQAANVVAIHASELNVRRPSGYRADGQNRGYNRPAPSQPVEHALSALKAAIAKPAPAPLKPQALPANPRTPERIALVEDLYPEGRDVADIIEQCNALPGPPVRSLDIMAWTVARGLKRRPAQA